MVRKPCIALLALVLREEGRPDSEPAARQEADLVVPPTGFPWTLPNLHFRKRTPHQDRRPLLEAGLRSVSLTVNPSGKPELRLTTADPNIVILLPMDETTHVN